jgi:hypothetical protein
MEGDKVEAREGDTAGKAEQGKEEEEQQQQRGQGSTPPEDDDGGADRPPDDPLLQTFDVIVMGTGMVESIVSGCAVVPFLRLWPSSCFPFAAMIVVCGLCGGGGGG